MEELSGPESHTGESGPLFSRRSLLQGTMYSAIVLVPLIFTWRTYNSFEVPKAFVLEALSLIILTLFLLSGRKPYAPPSISLFFFWNVFSLFWSQNWRVGVKPLALVASHIVLGLACINIMGGNKAREKMASCLVLAGAVTSLIGILQYFGLDFTQGITFSLPDTPPSKYDVYSTVGHPNYLGSLLIAAFPLCMTGILSAREKKKMIVPGGSGVLILVGLLMARAKGPWLGLVAALFFLVVLSRTHRRKLILYLVPSLLVLGIIIVVHPSFSWMVHTLLPGFVSNKVRILMWNIALMMIRDHPFLGNGLGGYGLHYTLYLEDFLRGAPDPGYYIDVMGDTKNVHNDFLQIWTELGIVGLGLFLWILWTYFTGVAKAGDPSVLGWAAGTVAILVHSLVEFPFYLPVGGMVFWTSLGMGWASSSGLTEKGTSTPPKEGIATPGSILLLCGVLFLVFSASRPVVGEMIHRDLYYLMNEGNYREAARLAEKGTSWDPLNEDLHLIRGSAHISLGKYQEALKECEKACSLFPEYMCLFDIGLAHLRMEHLKEAEGYFQRLIFLSPNVPDAYSALSEIRTKQGRPEEAQGLMEKVNTLRGIPSGKRIKGE